jgi:hypothetical protein
MTSCLTVTRPFRIERTQHGRKSLRSADSVQLPVAERVPRVARLMALAIHFDQLLSDGVVADQAELARLGHVSRARVTQIMNLLNLAPDIQEEILFLDLLETGRERVTERRLRRTLAIPNWANQRLLRGSVRDMSAQVRR